MNSKMKTKSLNKSPTFLFLMICYTEMEVIWTKLLVATSV